MKRLSITAVVTASIAISSCDIGNAVGKRLDRAPIAVLRVDVNASQYDPMVLGLKEFATRNGFTLAIRPVYGAGAEQKSIYLQSSKIYIVGVNPYEEYEFDFYSKERVSANARIAQKLVEDLRESFEGNGLEPIVVTSQEPEGGYTPYGEEDGEGR